VLLSDLVWPVGCGKHKTANRPDDPIARGDQADGAAINGTATIVSTGASVAGARVTLFTPDFAFFQETRSDATGAYSFSGVPPSSYRLGVAARGWKYEEVTVVAELAGTRQDVGLSPENEIGRWDVIGDTGPELFDATDIGILRTDGTLMFC